MFVRFRQTQTRLQVSLIETRRVNGKPRHEHLASLGAVALAPTVADRIGFWSRLHERLAKLSNRVDTAATGKTMAKVHAKVPMVTPDEQRALQLENAKQEAAQWSAISGIVDAEVSGGALLIEHHQAVIATAQP